MHNILSVESASLYAQLIVVNRKSIMHNILSVKSISSNTMLSVQSTDREYNAQYSNDQECIMFAVQNR